MANPIKGLVEGNQHIHAIFRVFSTKRPNVISSKNKIVGAYIFDWNNRISQNNHLVKAKIEISQDKEGIFCETVEETK